MADSVHSVDVGDGMDIVERLRDVACMTRYQPLLLNAADEIERLRDALRSIANIDDPENDAWAALDMAFQALEARP